MSMKQFCSFRFDVCPFFNIASLQSLGKQAVCKDCLKIICRILADTNAVFFRKRLGIASGPTAF